MDTRGYIDTFVQECFNRKVDSVSIVNNMQPDDKFHFLVWSGNKAKHWYKSHEEITSLIAITSAAYVDATHVCDDLGLMAEA